MLIPPFRFAYVETDVFRGAYPVDKNYPFIKTLKLKTIISLIPEEINEDLKNFCKKECIKNHTYLVPKFIDQVIITPNTVTQILTTITNVNNLPVYIHCLSGDHTTGLVIMCLRKLQMWSQKAMFNEFNQFVNTFESCEEEFVNNYKATFDLLNQRPSWLTHLTAKKSHPTLNIIFPEDADDQYDSENEEVNEEKEE